MKLGFSVHNGLIKKITHFPIEQHMKKIKSNFIILFYLFYQKAFNPYDAIKAPIVSLTLLLLQLIRVTLSPLSGFSNSGEK